MKFQSSGPWCSVDFLDSSPRILALPVAEENFMFILGMFVISDGIESRLWLLLLGFSGGLTIANRDLAWVLILFSFCRDTRQREEEVRGRLA